MHPISMPKFNIQEMRGSLENFEVLCRINNTRILSEIFLVWCRRYLGKLLMVSGRCAHRMTNSAIRSSKVCHSMVPLSTTLWLSDKLPGWQERRCSDDQKAFRAGNCRKKEIFKNYILFNSQRTTERLWWLHFLHSLGIGGLQVRGRK